MISKALKVFVLAALLVITVQSQAVAGEKSFAFVNLSGKTFYSLYVYQSGVSGGWGAYKDWLSMNTLKHGEQVTITFPEKVQDIKYWDIKIEFKDGKSWFWQGLDLLNVSKVIVNEEGTLTWNKP